MDVKLVTDSSQEKITLTPQRPSRWSCIRRLLGRANQDLPRLPIYMHPIEYTQLTALLAAIDARTVLEWGSGGSTQALLNDFPHLETLVSIEHDTGWHDQVRARLTDSRVRLYRFPCAAPEPNIQEDIQAWEAWMDRCEDEPELLRDYIDWPTTLDLTFDLVLVDGRARVHCMHAGWKVLRPGGLLVLHDAQRTRYHADLAALGRPVFLANWQQGQIAFVRKPDSGGVV